MTVIITVHGTSAGDPSDEGEKWWQRGSAFQRRLGEWLDLEGAGARVEPFHWGEGPNSEVARRKAGRALLKELIKHEGRGEDYYLIGHSHGGSVIHHALLEASSRRRKLPHLKRWITIGTPFIWMQQYWLLVRRLGNIGRVAYTMMIASFVGIFTGAPFQFYYAKDLTRALGSAQGSDNAADQISYLPGQLDAIVALQILSMPIMIVVLYYSLRWAQSALRRRYANRTQKVFALEFIDRWRSLRSGEDEAISALRVAEPVRFSLFKNDLLTAPLKNSIVYALLAVWGGFIVWQLILLARFGFSSAFYAEVIGIQTALFGDLLPAIDYDKLSADPVDFSALYSFLSENPGLAIGFFGSGVLGMLLFLLLGWLALWLVFTLVHGVAYVLGIPTSRFLNHITTNELRNSAYGNDTTSEYVADVMPMPQHCGKDCGVVPTEVERALHSHAEMHAALALARARKVLGMSSQIGGREDIAETLAKQLTGGELIHTSYFDVDEFSRLICVCLSDGGAAPLSESFTRHADYQNLLVWYESTKAQAVA